MRDEPLLHSKLLGSCSDRGHAKPPNPHTAASNRQTFLPWKKEKNTSFAFVVQLRFAPKMSNNPWPARPSPRKKATNGKLRCD